jgi:hypothetical protein
MDIYGDKTIAMRHFFAGIGEIPFWLFLLYLTMSTSPINSTIMALGMIWALTLVLSRVYRKYFYRNDDY